MTNQRNTVLYTGVTNNLSKRVFEHKEKLVPGFTKKYNVDKLIYYEVFDEIKSAINREKQIKAGSRADKIKLIKKVNPQFDDLYRSL
jgi:putative endonuclease